MRQYSNEISLSKNERGIYSIDPIIGCNSGMKLGRNGCYNDCYSAKSSRLYGYDFSKNVLRYFRNQTHYISIIREIENIQLPFIRMGSSGDPSENWEHTINICRLIFKGLEKNQFDIYGRLEKPKQIVIITKHWFELTEKQLCEISKYNICVNTSISAIDDELLEYRINQYERLKPYCKSLLRLVSFDFNEENEKGKNYAEIQRKLVSTYKVLDTVFRSSKSNPLLKNGIIKVHKTKFLGKNALISKMNKKTFFGKCNSCIEMCGVNM